MTPEQRRKNRNLAFVLVLMVIAVMAWAFWRGAGLAN